MIRISCRKEGGLTAVRVKNSPRGKGRGGSTGVGFRIPVAFLGSQHALCDGAVAVKPVAPAGP